MSVLGKRLRSAKEATTLSSIAPSLDAETNVASAAPPRKRTRRSTPAIFEDEETTKCTEKQTSAYQKPAADKARSSKSSSLRTKMTTRPQTNKSTKAIDFSDAGAPLSAVQDENCPPSEVCFETPSIARFKDVLDGSPNTPKHRVRAFSGLLTPKTPRTIDVTPRKEQSIYARARQLFTQSAAPTKLIGRDTERQQLRDFICNARSSNSGGCTYISGPPGTGKSALVQEVLQEYQDDKNVRVSIINCVSLRTAAQVYGKMLEDLSTTAGSMKCSPESQLKRLFMNSSNKVAHVVMLDEIDSLVDSECEILYNVFEWALNPSSSLSLIGVANALDLTDRFLPRLKLRGLKPQLLPFLPYTAQQISQIITDKLTTLLSDGDKITAGFVPCMHPAAIQLCGKKIASQTGDLRKAFSLVRRSIDQIEKETMATQMSSSPSKQPLGELGNVAATSWPQTPSKGQLSFTAESAPRATIAHVAKLASSIFNNGTTSRLSGLNLQQKAVLCSIVNKEVRRQDRNPFVTPTKTANRAPTVAELFYKYSNLCKRDDGLLQPLKDTEFRDVVASLETLGLVYESKARSSSLLTPSTSSRSSRSNDERQIVSAVSEKEMRETLTGPGADLLRRLLEEL